MEGFGLNELENVLLFAFGLLMGKLFADNERLKKELENEN